MSVLTTRLNQHSQRGMSLVELMVGITIGLFIVAAAVTLVAGQLADNRKLSLELQVQQDLRATADIITRQLRRAGFASVVGAQSGVASPESAPASLHQMGELKTYGPDFDRVEFHYYYNAGDRDFGYLLEGGVIKAKMGDRWQELTDPRTLRVTTFSITPALGLSSRLPCLTPCPPPNEGTSNCWPELQVRELAIVIRGHAVGDSQVVREVNSRVRLRNDFVRFNDAVPPTQACPPG